MKIKLLLAATVACVLGFSSCSNESVKTIPVYGWQGEGEEATEASIQSDFKKWKDHGLVSDENIQVSRFLYIVNIFLM